MRPSSVSISVDPPRCHLQTDGDDGRLAHAVDRLVHQRLRDRGAALGVDEAAQDGGLATGLDEAVAGLDLAPFSVMRTFGAVGSADIACVSTALK